jgi:O-antigen ligase
VGLGILLSPALVIGGLGLLANSNVVQLLSRQRGDFSTATNRLHIWEPVWSYLQHPSLDMLYGFGANGHITSGVSRTYGYLFAGTVDPTSYTTHNVVLQTALDVGYLGVVVFLVLVVRSLALLQRSTEPVGTAAFAILTILLLSGMTEAQPSYRFMDTFGAFLLLVGVAATAPQTQASASALAYSVPSRASAPPSITNS